MTTNSEWAARARVDRDNAGRHRAGAEAVSYEQRIMRWEALGRGQQAHEEAER